MKKKKPYKLPDLISEHLKIEKSTENGRQMLGLQSGPETRQAANLYCLALMTIEGLLRELEEDST